MKNGRLTYENLPDVYKQLSSELPKEAIEHVPSAKSRKGYDTTGYGYQYCVNRLNEVIFGHWRDIATVIKTEAGTTNSGKTMYKVIIHMTIQIGNWHWIDGENKFEVLAQGSEYGGHDSLEESSAYKGAYTNAFKKAAAMLGVGKKAFEGVLDDDLLGIEAQINPQQFNGNHHQSNKNQSQRQSQQSKPNNVTNLQGKATEKQIKAMFAVARKKSLANEYLKELMTYITKKESSKELTKQEASDLIKLMEESSLFDLLGMIGKQPINNGPIMDDEVDDALGGNR